MLSSDSFTRTLYFFPSTRDRTENEVLGVLCGDGGCIKIDLSMLGRIQITEMTHLRCHLFCDVEVVVMRERKTFEGLCLLL